MGIPRVYADFQKLDDNGRLILTTAGSQKDLQRIRGTLCNGLHVVFYSDDIGQGEMPDDLEVEGELLFDPNAMSWIGVFDATGFRHASERNVREI